MNAYRFNITKLGKETFWSIYEVATEQVIQSFRDEKKAKELNIDMFLIFDKGVVKIISNDIERVIISFMGDKMKGCFSIVPYRKYQYLFMKIPYVNCK